MKHVVMTLAVYLLWNLGVSVALLVPPPRWSAIATIAFLWLVLHYLVGSGSGPVARRKRVRVRLRPPPAAAWKPVAVALPLLVVLSGALGGVWSGLAEVPPESANPFLPFLEERDRRLAIALYVIGVAPLVEEIVFRGVVQRRLERRIGPAAAIPAAALVFAALHFLPRVLVPLLVLGAALGYVTWATRSLWPAVLLHVANNTLAYVALVLWEEEATQTIWQTGVTSDWLLALATLVASCAAAVPLARWLRRAGRPTLAPSPVLRP